MPCVTRPAAAVFLLAATAAPAAAQWTVSRLHPAQAVSSSARAAGANGQVGWAEFRGSQSTLRSGYWWRNPPASPQGFNSSEGESVLHGIGGTQQVGWRRMLTGIQREPHATLWLGSPPNPVDLHPGATGSSVAYDTDGARQVGEASLTGIPRAFLWNGSPGLWTDLNPAGAAC